MQGCAVKWVAVEVIEALRKLAGSSAGEGHANDPPRRAVWIEKARFDSLCEDGGLSRACGSNDAHERGTFGHGGALFLVEMFESEQSHEVSLPSSWDCGRGR